MRFAIADSDAPPVLEGNLSPSRPSKVGSADAVQLPAGRTPLAPDDIEFVGAYAAREGNAFEHNQGGHQWHRIFRLPSQDEAWSQGWR